jgi:protein SMG6
MLFARIDLDSFDSTLARFTERLQLDQQPGFGVKESEWVMMGVLNLGAILEYGKEGVLKRVGALGPIGTAPKPKVVEKIVGRGGQRQDSLTIEGGDGHDSHMGPDGGSKWGIDEVMAEPDEMMAISPTDDNEPRSTPAISQPEPPSDHLFQLSLRLTFTLLSLVLKNPYLPHPTRKHYLNPYITIILTFLWTIFKHQPALEVLEKNIPWEELVALLNDTTARRHSRGGSLPEVSSKALIGGGPLPEDHCLRGMEWVGRRVYERGFWRPGAKPNATSSSSCVSGEMDVLTGPLIRQVDDGYVEDGEGGDIEDVPTKRCKRVMLLTEGLVKAVPGLEWDHTSDKPKLRIGGELEVKMREWEEEREREAEEARRRNGRKSWNESDEMDVDEVEEEEEDEEDDDDELDSEDVKALKARRRYLQSLLRPRSQPTRPPQSRRQRPKVQRAVATTTKERPPLNVVPGYTVLVIDTNILLSSLSMIASLVESRRWTLVVPLAGKFPRPSYDFTFD